MTHFSPDRQCRNTGHYPHFLRRVKKVGGFVLQRRVKGEEAGGKLDIIVRANAVGYARAKIRVPT